MECLGRVPAPGDTVTIDGLHVEVEQVDRRVVRSVLVEPLAGAPAPEEGGS
jgi:CBS domain containing-hemolysin-like protein